MSRWSRHPSVTDAMADRRRTRRESRFNVRAWRLQQRDIKQDAFARGSVVNRQDAKAPRKAGIGRGWYRVEPPEPWRLGDLGGSIGDQTRICRRPDGT